MITPGFEAKKEDVLQLKSDLENKLPKQHNFKILELEECCGYFRITITGDDGDAMFAMVNELLSQSPAMKSGEVEIMVFDHATQKKNTVIKHF